jgi:AraC-like DNA-binding protein
LRRLTIDSIPYQIMLLGPSYSTHEALHLSEKEKTTVISVFESIEEELKGRIDNFSQDVVISQIELLLNYANRFYSRQFITRKAVSSDLLEKVEDILRAYELGFEHPQSFTKLFKLKTSLSPLDFRRSFN